MLKLPFLWPSWKVNENIKFLRNKVQGSKHSSVTARESLTQFAKYLGHTGPRKCNNRVFWVPLKMVKGKGRNHRTSREATRIISCYLKARGKETLRSLEPVRGSHQSATEARTEFQIHMGWEPLESASCPSFLILLSFHYRFLSLIKTKSSSWATE